MAPQMAATIGLLACTAKQILAKISKQQSNLSEAKKKIRIGEELSKIRDKVLELKLILLHSKMMKTRT